MKKILDTYMPVVLLYAMAAFFLLDTKDFTPDSIYYPRGLALILFALSTLLLVLSLLGRVAPPKGNANRTQKKFLTIFLSSLAYVVVIRYLGFVIASLIYCPFTAISLGYKNKLRACLVSIGVVALIYVGFRVVLKVPLPAATIFGFTI